MCILCGIAQSVTLLGIGYTPTAADMQKMTELNAQIQTIARDEQSLIHLENSIERVKEKSLKTNNRRAQYLIHAMDDMIEFYKIFPPIHDNNIQT